MLNIENRGTNYSSQIWAELSGNVFGVDNQKKQTLVMGFVELKQKRSARFDTTKAQSEGKILILEIQKKRCSHTQILGNCMNQRKTKEVKKMEKKLHIPRPLFQKRTWKGRGQLHCPSTKNTKNGKICDKKEWRKMPPVPPEPFNANRH
ncbi:uncharacterized protein V6R79_018458 [Siganus canaliculatus]